MTPANLASQFGDTTYTKVFVGGLAWETQKETMKKYFERFGEILEAVVITDKTTCRSKGYGFVTFRDPEAASRACVDASPVIDGRRANCNLASLGVHRSKPSTPKLGGRNVRVAGSFQATTAFPSFPHYSIQQAFPYNFYGYSTYSPDYAFPASYYHLYGRGVAQYPVYGTGPSGIMATGTGSAFYQYTEGGAAASGYGTGQGYTIQYPQHVYHYSTGGYSQQYAAPLSFAPAAAMQSVCYAMPQS